MNQILSTEDPNKRKAKAKTKTTNNSEDFKKIVKVFGIVILIFGAVLAGIYAYKLMNGTKKTKFAKPEIVLEELNEKATITVKSEAGINKITYYWNDNEQTEKSLNGSSEYSESIEIPKGENVLTVKVVDKNDQESETTKEYLGTKDTEKPVIDIDKSTGYITVKDETELAYVTYKWEDEDDDTTVKVEVEPEEGEEIAKEIEIPITPKKGTNILVITAVDAAGNTEVCKKTYKGTTDPEIDVYREGEYLYLNIKHELGFKKVEFTVNGQDLVYDENQRTYDATKSELSYKFKLVEGENKVEIVATSNEDTVRKYNGQCQYP